MKHAGLNTHKCMKKLQWRNCNQKSDISWHSLLFKSSPRPLTSYECSFSSQYPRTTQTIDPSIAVTWQMITIALLLSNKNPSGINCSIHSQDGRWLKYVLTFPCNYHFVLSRDYEKRLRSGQWVSEIIDKVGRFHLIREVVMDWERRPV